MTTPTDRQAAEEHAVASLRSLFRRYPDAEMKVTAAAGLHREVRDGFTHSTFNGTAELVVTFNGGARDSGEGE